MSTLIPEFTLPKDFCADAREAYTIPARFYTHRAAFEHEKSRCSPPAGFAWRTAASLPNRTTTSPARSSVKTFWWCVARQRAARLYNVCPHRGHQLLAGDGRAKNVITCPYHARAFRLDGELAHARNCENVQNFDKENSHLMPVRVEEYAGFIYVNLDSQAGTVEDQLPGLGAKVREACPQVDDLKLAARFVTRTPANWKNIVDNYLECYHCGPAHPGFADSVQVDRYWHTLHGNWTLQFGYARPSEQSFKFEEGKEASFHGIWLWPCTMFNMPPLEGMMTVIYEFPVDAETTLQHYDIYFTNADLSDEQLKLIDWYRDVFRPEDLRLVESVQKASNRAAIAAVGASWPTAPAAASANTASPTSTICWRRFINPDATGPTGPSPDL